MHRVRPNEELEGIQNRVEMSHGFLKCAVAEPSSASDENSLACNVHALKRIDSL